MTQRYFLAAKKRLPIGIFGRKETKRVERDKAFLGSELDFAAIVVREIKKQRYLVICEILFVFPLLQKEDNLKMVAKRI
ncbi:hypothetical protein [Bacillus cereus]|uniref:hypothetical protein n=1 Tax=Bacillus cereus TaxID=1396 RepID=UPI000C2842F3|nr:hypothetical protein [Bacillus cereus]